MLVGCGNGILLPHAGREIGPPLFYRILDQLGIGLVTASWKNCLGQSSERSISGARAGTCTIWTRLSSAFGS